MFEELKVKSLLQYRLYMDETILWWGRPVLTSHFSKGDWFMVPLTIIMLGPTLLILPEKISQTTDIKLILTYSFSILFSLYFIFGRFIYKFYQKKRQYYVLTNQRAISFETINNKYKNFNYAKISKNAGVVIRSYGLTNHMNLHFISNEYQTTYLRRNYLAIDFWNTGLSFIRPKPPFGQCIAFYDLPKDEGEKAYILATTHT